MIFYLSCTPNLGDFLNGIPVMSGMVKSHNQKITLLIRPEMRKFVGIKDFLKFQTHIFEDVLFADENLDLLQQAKNMSSWTREDRNSSIRPTETCRYENYLKDTYKINFEVDDDVELMVPELNINVDDIYVGDRWSHSPDHRRIDHQMSNIGYGTLIDFSDDIMTNAYRIKKSKKPFIGCFTGISILSDLMKKDTLVVWKPEDFAPEFRRGERDIWWDNKNINQVFDKHYYKNRNSRLVHVKDLKNEVDIINENN